MITLSARASRRRLPRLIFGLLMVLTLAPTGALAQPSPGDGVTRLTGSAEIVASRLDHYTEPFVSLIDITTLFRGSTPAVSAQFTGGVESDGETLEFALALPIQPLGEPINITGSGPDEMPLVFTLNLMSNVAGTPYMEEADYWGGAPVLLTSLAADAEGFSGQLVVWSAGDGAEFPSGAGEDGEALTRDDPMEELQPGWTVVDITGESYDFSRSAEQEIEFTEDFVNPNDLSEESWTDAFDDLVDQLELEYPFTELKDIDFDELRETYRPMIEEAEQEEDRDAWVLALYRFALEFGDAHVSSNRPEGWFEENYGGGFGLTVDQADDGTVVVVDVADGGPADEAGLEPGDVITEWDGDHAQDVLETVDVPRSISSDVARASERLRWLTRGPEGLTVEVRFTDGEDASQSAEMRATADPDGLRVMIQPADVPSTGVMPIESEVLPSGVGYIRINTFSTDTVLFTHQWDYALRTFEQIGVTDLVIDVRGNAGGYSFLSLYATASFVDEPFVLGEAYVPDGEGGFEAAYDEYVVAGPEQWDGSVAVLVDVGCKSSCEMFAATMAGVERDGIDIVGHTPSGGAYTAIQRWDLPADVSFRASHYRFEIDGEILLEESGVALDVDVPVTVDSLLSPEDEVLAAAEALVDDDDTDTDSD